MAAGLELALSLRPRTKLSRFRESWDEFVPVLRRNFRRSRATLVSKMAAANPLWGAPRIHGELGRGVSRSSERTVSRLLRRPRRPPSQTWRNSLKNHVATLASIGSIRRECLDHVVVLGERHLRRTLAAYLTYYHRSRTHLSLAKDAPTSRPVEPTTEGDVIVFPEVGGLHHRYERRAA